MASSLKSGPKTYSKVVKDSLRNKAEIKQGNDVKFVKQMEERGFDTEKFVFDGYEDVAEPNTDPDHLNCNSKENVNTNLGSKMTDRQKRKSERNWLNKAKKREVSKALAEVEAKNIVDQSAESLEKAAAKALTEAIKVLVEREKSLINDNLDPTSRVQAKTHTCPLGSEETHITDWSTDSTIWNCKHSDVFNSDDWVFGFVEVPKISTEDTPQSCFPIVCGDWDVRDMRKMVADLVQDDDAASWWAGWALANPEFASSLNPITTRGADYAHQITASPPGFENPAASLQDDDEEEVNENLRDLFKKMLEVDVFNQEDNEFYENYKFYDEVSDDTGIGESSKDNSVHSEGSDGPFCIVKRLLRRNGYQVQL